jgi:galactose-1-phosphate uridylyltransferase
MEPSIRAKLTSPFFKRHRWDAVAGLEHPQLIATAVISRQVRERFEPALNHYDEFGACMFGQSGGEETEDRDGVVLRTDHLVACKLYASPTPSAPLHPIYPCHHMDGLGDISAVEIAGLAGVLRTVFWRSSTMTGKLGL